MPRRGARTRRVVPSRAPAYLEKAHEFLSVAEQALDDSRSVAATRLAVHAGVNASDAICVARLGQRAAGPAHDEVRALLKEAGPEGAEAGRHLGRLLPLKTKAEYDADAIPQRTATNAVRWASRLADLARHVVEGGGGRP